MGLFEWGHWFKSGLPNWLQIDELVDFGYPNNSAYKSIFSKNEISPNESLLQYFNRSFSVVNQILDRHPEGKFCTVFDIGYGLNPTCQSCSTFYSTTLPQ